VIAVWLGVVSSPSWAAESIGERARLAASKLALVRSLLDDGSAPGRADRWNSDAAKDLIATARRAYEEAASACPSDVERCITTADRALKAITAASRLVSWLPDDDTQARTRYAQSLELVRGFRGAIERLQPFGNKVFVEAEIAAVDHLTVEAEQLASTGRWVDAAATLKRATDRVQLALSRLVDGKTIVYSLSFRGPKEEYAYEIERFRGLHLLTQLMLAEQPALAASRATITELMASSVQRRDEAAALASAGDYVGALRELEESSVTLSRVLRMTGVPLQ